MDGSSGSIHTGTSSAGSCVSGFATTTAVQPRRARGGQRASDQRLAAQQRHRLRAAHAAAAAAREHRHDHAPTASAPSSLRSLTCSCSGENGAARRSSAPAARGSRPAFSSHHQQHLRVARQRVGAQRAHDLRAVPRITRSGCASRAASSAPSAASCSPPARPGPRARSRACSRRRPPAARASAAPRRPRRASPRSPARTSASRLPVLRGGVVSDSGPAASTTARAAAIRSLHVPKRRSGDLSSAFAITSSRPSGRSGPHARGLRRLLGQVRVDHGHVGVARVRQLAGQAVVEHAAERVDVGARGHLARPRSAPGAT